MNQDDLIERATTIQKEILKWQTLLASASQTRRRQETATHSQLNVQQGMRSMIKLREIDSQHLQLKFLSKGRDDLESRVDLLQNEHRQSETTRINLLAELKVKEEVITSQEAEIREQRQQLEKILCCKRDTDQIQHLHTLITAIQTQHRSVQDEVALLKTEHGLSVKKLLTSRDLLKHSQERCKQLSERESEAMKLLSHKCAALANLQSSHAALRAEHDMVQMEKQMIEKKLAILMEEVKVERKAHADLEEALSHTKEANLKLLQNLQGAVESHNSSVERFNEIHTPYLKKYTNSVVYSAFYSCLSTFRVKVENETMREKLDKLVGELYLQGRPKESMKMSSTTR